jgi:hypothetical protein
MGDAGTVFYGGDRSALEFGAARHTFPKETSEDREEAGRPAGPVTKKQVE